MTARCKILGFWLNYDQDNKEWLISEQVIPDWFKKLTRLDEWR